MAGCVCGLLRFYDLLLVFMICYGCQGCIVRVHDYSTVVELIVRGVRLHIPFPFGLLSVSARDDPTWNVLAHVSLKGP